MSFVGRVQYSSQRAGIVPSVACPIVTHFASFIRVLTRPIRLMPSAYRLTNRGLTRMALSGWAKCLARRER
jgi:hypothetical protein